MKDKTAQNSIDLYLLSDNGEEKRTGSSCPV